MTTIIIANVLLSEEVDSLPLTWGMIAVIGSVASGTAFLTWFLRNQLSGQTRTFYRIISRHNREDDDRFAQLSDDVWHLREQIAKVSGNPLPSRKTLGRRRYLVDDTGQEEGSDGG